jgi:pre-mRNA-splicing factor 18
MDFKKLMSAQISKSKPATNGDSKNKYLRRAEIEAERQAKYEEEQRRLDTEREERAAKKRKLEEADAEQNSLREAKMQKFAEESKIRRETQEREEERARRRRLGLPDLPEPKDEDEDQTQVDVEDVPDDELRSKLRNLGEPVVLYGESHVARLQRYYVLTGKSLITKPQMTKGPIPSTLQPVEEKDMLIPEQLPVKDDTDGIMFVYRQLASYFTLLLTEWSVMLAQRDEATSSSATGRTAYNSYLTVLADLTTMYRKMESNTLEHDLLPMLCEIVRYIQKRQYVKANDAYLRVSIGKAAYPIGLVAVGIHERSAREKLHEPDKQARIMSDEATRKMLQSIKRCISFAQARWPPDDLGQLMG